MKQLLHRASLVLGMSLPTIFFSVGCDKEKSIQTYQAPKEPQAQTVAEKEPGFPGDLRWNLPSGWKQVAVKDSPVFKPVAAIAVSADQPDLQLTVSQLPNTPPARDVFQNVVRWARQLQMPAPSEADLPNFVNHTQIGDVPVDIVKLGGSPASASKLLGAIIPHGDDTWVFKLSGPQSAVDAQASAFAEFLSSVHFEGESEFPASSSGRQPPPVQGPPVPSSDDQSLANGAEGIKWTLPAGWTAQTAPPGPMRALALIHPGNGSSEIKVSRLGQVGGGLTANVNRWRGSVGLPPVDEANADAGSKMNLGGQDWSLHDYTGPANGGTRLIVASTEGGGGVVFFKYTGPADEVAKHKAEFEQLLGSLKFDH